jgi:hypothetical protein
MSEVAPAHSAVEPFKGEWFLYVPPGLKNPTWCSRCFKCCLRVSERTASFAVYIIN